MPAALYLVSEDAPTNVILGAGGGAEAYGAMVQGTKLVTVGYGKSKLKDPSQPLAEVNRRVQVVNMENKTTASNAAK